VDQGALTVVTPPASEPITLPDLKLHLRVDAGDTSQDTNLAAYLSAVRAWIERIAGIAFLAQTLEWAIDQFPWAEGAAQRLAGGWPSSGFTPLRTPGDNRFGSIQLPRPPLVSIGSVKYLDASGTLITMDPSLYLVDARSTPGRLTPAYGTWWPTTRWQPNAVIVQYAAGYANAAAVPADWAQALRLAAGAMWEYREDLVDGGTPVETGLLRRLLAPLRTWTAA